MGAGKSTVGRILAERTGRFFLDADALIEAAVGRDVASIFEKEGEARFREMERKCAAWLARCVRGAVVSTGGGMPTVVTDLRAIGTVVYLKLPFEAILSRIGPDERARRPLFRDPDAAKRIYDERVELYETQAQIVVDARQPAEAVARSILERVA